MVSRLAVIQGKQTVLREFKNYQEFKLRIEGTMSQFLMKNLCADPRLRSGNFAEDCTEGGRRARYVHIRGNGNHDRSMKQHAALRPWIGVHREAAVGHDQSGVSRVACNWTWRANWTWCGRDDTAESGSGSKI